MNPFRYLQAILVAATFSIAISHDASAADPPRISVGISYADAAKQLAIASITKTGPLQIAPRDPDIAFEFFNLSRSAILVIGRSAATKLVKTLSIYYIPDNRTIRSQVVEVEARSIEFHSDRSYVVHFEAP